MRWKLETQTHPPKNSDQVPRPTGVDMFFTDPARKNYTTLRRTCLTDELFSFSEELWLYKTIEVLQ